jgi:colanic acid biosynthesis glycosyl transferase WcaI
MQSRLRIGYMIQDFPPEVGAGPARAFEMATRWQEHGASVTAMVGMPNRRLPGRGEGGVDSAYRGKLFMEEDWEGIRTLRSWLYTGNGRGLVAKTLNNASFMVSSFLHAGARRDKFDVLIASSPPFLPHVSATALSRLRGIPLVLEIRDLWPDYMVEMGLLENRRARAALFALERRLLHAADHVIVVTESFRNRVIAKGVRPDRVDVIPNGVDVTYYHTTEKEKPPFSALERDSGEFLVGYLGTFGRGQGLEYVVRAAGFLEKTGHKIRFVLAGDGPELTRVKDEIEKLHVKNVTLHPPIPRGETRAFYNSCDVCLVPLAPIPIFSETIPSKIFEIMACERPLVASVSGEGAAIVDRSRGGIRVEPGDAPGLAKAIQRVRAMSGEEREAMGRRAREFVSAHFDRLALADKYLEILRMVTERGRKGKLAERGS